MWQFGLKTLLTVTLLAAVACTIFFVLPSWYGLLSLMVTTHALAGPLVAGVVYGRGYGRAFAIGALAAYGAWLYAWGWNSPFERPSYTLSRNLFLDPDREMRIVQVSLCWPLVTISGVLGVVVRWASLRNVSKE